MEVNKDNFKQELLSIFQHIADATYITFDLEMSGIATRNRNKNGNRAQDTGKPSLQHLYDENRQAAESFQVLQVGITFVEEDREKEFYLARPYNFFLSPLSADGLDIKLDRDFSFSSSACDFLKGCGFDFGKVFSSGIPYLSQEEEDELRDEFERRAEKNKKLPDITIPPSDTKALEFYSEARKKLRTWVEDTNPEKDHFLNIGTDDGPLTGFQRRLVYQLVRAEFSGLRVFGRNNGDFMQVEKLDEMREADFQRRGLDRFNSQISTQKGLRWVYEALTNGDLDAVNPAWFCDPNTEDYETELLLKRKEFAAVKAKLKEKEHIIIGHNVFVDLIYLHRTFTGSLPMNVKHFQEDIHDAFPIVIDTKYLATHGDGQSHTRSTLKDLLMPLKRVHEPLILLEENHTAYGSAIGKEHEAGYDSWMTAELFVKLAMKLYAKTKPTPPSSKAKASEVKKKKKVSPDFKINKDNKFALLSLESTSASEEDDNVDGSPSEEGLRTGGVTLASPAPSSQTLSISSPPPLLSLLLQKLVAGGDTRNDVASTKIEEENDGDAQATRQWLPDIKHKFWRPYLNKLRVNASDAGVCDLEEGADD